MNNDELTPDEHASLRRARADAVPPRDLEEATVAALRERGLVRSPLRVRPIASAAWIWITAAALVIVAGGLMVWRTAPASPVAASPRYVLLLYAGGTPIAGVPDTRRREYAEWARGVASGGVAISGEELADEAHEIGAPASSDAAAATPQPAGPLPRGFFVVSAPDFETAQRIASTCPHLRYGGRIVVKKIVS